ncbi:MAG TPA: CarD family transcriptional regulator [Firmicutes bacterium]|nr:CarD family transcriptional regulator [Bacillota bacterium]
MFSIGDKIVHPMHGAGIIESIVAEKIDGTYHDYYVFKMPMNGLVLKIPTNNADAIGIRPIDSPEQIEAVFCMLPQLSSDMSNNWNRRYRENLAHLKSGDLLEVASVIKGLMHRDSLRGLSTGERKMLYIAKQILISEVSLAEDTDYGAVEQRINDAVKASE